MDELHNVGQLVLVKLGKCIDYSSGVGSGV